MNAEPPAATAHGRVIIALITLAVFLFAVHALPALIGHLVRWDGYANAAAVKTAQAAVIFLAVGIVLRIGLRRVAAELGLVSSVGAAAAVAFLATAPMLVAFSITGTLRVEYAPLQLAVTAFFSPVGEEVLYRGYAFGQLYQRAKWRFLSAVLIPTLFFSLGHLYQAADVKQAIGVFAVTAIGSIWFAWLYARWQNLWVPIMLHALMNLWWYIFEVDTTALGGWLANIARLLTIVLSVAVTLLAPRMWKSDRDARSMPSTAP
jgi:hypothetical protein